MPGTVRRWPLFLIAAPAAVAVWSGWVGLGELCGFGIIHPLPGIWPALQLNTAIPLPVGVEAYAAYALGAWMSPGSPPGARRFARWSALGVLGYGMTGQIIYHLLAAAHATQAPWPVVVVVSCMPVAVLGLAAALTHLLCAATVTDSQFVAVPSDTVEAAKASLRATVATGNPLSVNQLQERFSLSRGTRRKYARLCSPRATATQPSKPPGRGSLSQHAPGPGLSPKEGHQNVNRSDQ